MKDRFVVLAEFSEIHGPLPLITIPNDIDKNTKEEIGNFVGKSSISNDK